MEFFKKRVTMFLAGGAVVAVAVSPFLSNAANLPPQQAQKLTLESANTNATVGFQKDGEAYAVVTKTLPFSSSDSSQR
jgi:uncharacterized protein YdbL (DUF1318 family)